jgi:nucleoid-associated protein YgaU
MSHNCPICNKAGLPDFTINEVNCPQCNSQLKAFLLLNSISSSNKKKPGIYFLWGLALLTVLFFGLFLKSTNEKNLAHNNNIILRDSITNLVGQKIVLEKIIKERQINRANESTLKYVVKKGDNLYKIAQFFYGDGNMYKQIEADNNLKQPYSLKIGQILLIKI